MQSRKKSSCTRRKHTQLHPQNSPFHGSRHMGTILPDAPRRFPPQSPRAGSPPGIPSPLTYTDARGRNASREGTICPCSHSEFAGGQLDLFASRSHCNETGTRASLPEDLQTGQLDALSPLDALPPNARAGSASSVSDQPVYKFDGCWESRQRRAPVQVCEKV